MQVQCTYYQQYMTIVLITVACLDFPCPIGSECRVCEKTNQAYCEYSCRNNGGCPEGTLCHLDVQSCKIGECCANNITCERKLLNHSSYITTCNKLPIYL